MTGNLGDHLAARLAGSRLDTVARALAWAAFQGDSDLQAALAGRGNVAAVPPQGTLPAPLAGTYLKSITVEGFRGIGPSSRLELTPGPGLTLVIGRNGSGKSSFAEGLEILLTGHYRRWADRAAVWKGGWRNLHQSTTAKITAEFHQESNTRSTILERSWMKDAELADSTSFAQIQGQRRGTIAALGWDAALSSVRPILSYNELGSLLDEGPSKLYDALAAVLGLDELNAAGDRLKKAAAERTKAQGDAKKELKGRILPELAASDDDRARTAHELLSKRAPNLDAVRALVTRSGLEDSAGLAVLQALVSLQSPNADEIGAAADRLVAADMAADSVGTEAGQARKLASLLEQALALHQHAGDQPCPVCGTGQLDDSWRERATAELADLKAKAATADRAATELVQAGAAIKALLIPPPASLGRAGEVGLDAGEVLEAWEALTASADPDPSRLAQTARRAGAALAPAVDRLVEASRVELNKREDAWRPLALVLASWLERSDQAERSAAQVEALKAAEVWLQNAIEELRNERFGPIAERATAVFELMRHDSHVQLESVELAGTGNRRRVRLKVTVDGVDGAALGVMSQGELNALALSLFLPRATLEESPFRFVVIDDPVQAMDPNRVDGLARALEQVAKTRQVIVFTHDERLPAAARRLGVPATVIEVQRRENSVVELTTTDEPVIRYLSDARALALTHELPDAVKTKVIPNFLRLALEAACHEVVWRRRLLKGANHNEIERLLDNKRTKQLMALALFDDETRAGDVLGKLDGWDRRLADVYREINEGTHGAAIGGFGPMILWTDTLVKRVREQA